MFMQVATLACVVTLTVDLKTQFLVAEITNVCWFPDETRYI